MSRADSRLPEVSLYILGFIAIKAPLPIYKIDNPCYECETYAPCV